MKKSSEKMVATKCIIETTKEKKNWCKCKMAQVFASNYMEKGGATQYGKTAKVHCTIRSTGAR